MRHTSESGDELRENAENIIRSLAPIPSGATILALSGDLGAGKTTFAQGAAAALGVTESVVSPTFVIEKVYELGSGHPWRRLVHIDAYRLAGAHELAALGWRERIAERDTLILIEWPERVEEIVPEHAKRLRFSSEEGRRHIDYD